MDRAGAVTRSEPSREHRNPVDDFILPSRSVALETLAAALHSKAGPVLLTGEAGVGKSWLCAKLRDAMPARWRWATVDLSPAIDEAGLHRLILHAFRTEPAGGPADARAALTEILAEGHADGVHWGLIVEEAQTASPGVLEELRILANRLGAPGALAGLVLVGQTALARRLATRPFAALQGRIAASAHLRPLDVEELQVWLGRLDPARAWGEPAAERLHRETAGSPRRVLAKATRSTALTPAVAAESRRGPETARAIVPPAIMAATPQPAPIEPAPAWDAPPVGPGKPPLQVGDGMIEVGWEPDADRDPDTDSDSDTDHEPEPRPDLKRPAFVRPSLAPVDLQAGTAPRPPDNGAGGAVEVIDDHYAALQAWTEWAQNQGRDPVSATTAAAADITVDPRAALDPDENPSSRLGGHPDVWAEGQQEFAPYSQLFSRLRQPRAHRQ